MSAGAPIDVVVGMLRRNDGSVLLGSRPDGKPYAGYWEFPGGKIEHNEGHIEALKRELREELGIATEKGKFAWTIDHRYAHAHVRLHFYWITQWSGEVRRLEGQQTAWVGPQDAWPYPVLAATVPLLGRIRDYRG